MEQFDTNFVGPVQISLSEQSRIVTCSSHVYKNVTSIKHKVKCYYPMHICTVLIEQSVCYPHSQAHEKPEHLGLTQSVWEQDYQFIHQSVSPQASSSFEEL